MKKIVKAVLAASALLSLAATGCDKKGNQASGNDAVPSEYQGVKAEIDPATGKIYDFGGMSIVVGDWWSPETPGEAKTPAEEAQRAYREWIQKTYNFKMVQKASADWNSQPETVANFCTTGGDENFVFVVDARSMTAGMKANLFYDLSKVNNIDWNNSKWVSASKALMSKGSSFYGMRATAPEPRGGIFFNKRLLKEAGIEPDSIYDMQKNGTWTWETFEDMLKKTTRDTDNDGIPDVYGMANLSTEFIDQAMMSNGTFLIGKDASGKYYNNAGDDKVIEAMSWSANLAKNYEKPQPEGANWDWMYAAFKNGETAFIAHQEYFVGDLADVADDFGFVCFPLGPNGDKKYKSMLEDWVMIIPAVYDDERAAKIAKAFDLWSNPTPGFDSWKDDYYAKFRDVRAVDETLQLMKDNGIARYDLMITGLQRGDIMWNVYPGYATPQEKYEETKNAWQALIDACN